MQPCPNCDGPCIPSCVMSKRTVEDLLAERRATILESVCDPDKTAKAMLLAHVDEIDREIARRRMWKAS